jgi:hypothetical protein
MCGILAQTCCKICFSLVQLFKRPSHRGVEAEFEKAVRHANLLKIPTHIIEHHTRRNSKSLDLVPRYAESVPIPQKVPPRLKKPPSFHRSKSSITTSPPDRHHPTPAENSILDFLSDLSQFCEDFTADTEIACNSLNRYEANWTPRMVTAGIRYRCNKPDALPTNSPGWTGYGIEPRIRSGSGRPAGRHEVKSRWEAALDSENPTATASNVLRTEW